MSIEVGYNAIAGGVDYRSSHKGLVILGRSDCTCDFYAILSLSLPQKEIIRNTVRKNFNLLIK